MKWLERSWRGLLTVWIVLAPSARALADDPGRPAMPQLPRVLSPGAPIPANGGILIESGDRTLVTAVVSDSTGALVEGTTTLLSTRLASYFAWKPTGELSVGTYSVELRDGGGTSLDDGISIEVIAATDRASPVLALSPSVSALTEPVAHACCLTVNEDGVDHCTVTEQQTLAQVDPGLSSTATVGELNQFLFRVRAAVGSVSPMVSSVFLPFGANAAMRFDTADDEYCMEIDLLDIVTMEQHKYPDLVGCVASSSVSVGTSPVELTDAFLTDALCVRPPVGHEARWCEVNGDACSDAATERCLQRRSACEGDAGSEADAGASEPDASLPEPESNESCSASAPGARGATGSFVYFALLALLLRRASVAAR